MVLSYSSQRKEHALHNYEAFLYLIKAKDDQFLDWAITTAYYSANHYVKSKIFPVKENSKDIIYEEFDAYCIKKNKYKGRSLHKVLIDLAYRELPNEIAGSLKKLHDYSDTARYHDYKLSMHGKKDSLKKDIQSKMDKVKDFCTI